MSGLIQTIKHDLAGVDLRIAAGMVANIISTVTCVLFNKVLFENDFRYATFLTFIHMFTNSIFVYLTSMAGIFEVKKVEIMRVFPLGCSFVASVVSLNLSLQYNSVGFYQVMKIMIIPTLVVMQTFLYGQRSSYHTKLSLLPICLGVGLATTSDVEVNFMGTLMAVVGCITTAVHQIWGNLKQKELGLNALQVLYYQAPISALILIFLIPIFDETNTTKGLLNYEYDNTTLIYIGLSSLMAYGVNITSYLIIGKASPVTYQVVGHFKTCLVLGGGFILFDATVSNSNLAGIGVAFIGMVWYSHIKLSENAPAAAVVAPKETPSSPQGLYTPAYSHGGEESKAV
eukprot:TRINITY_DN6856_c0_g1_i2.p1 TRINITY_DN6856_c0_g1~~TRINITY_DN6856_c0_g1_i2.p1  ORF type:complete len:343 (-),score=76.55 TRINITY_DN6856_c0_g1_i2:1069-2097(-)